MKKLIITLLLLASPVSVIADEENIYPPEVQKFIQYEITCIHFMGEITGQDDERGRQVNAALEKYCHSDEEFKAMQTKYIKDPYSIEVFSYFGEQRK